MKNKKWKLYLILGGIVVVAYAGYARFLMEKTPIGGLCSGGASCAGVCLGFGDLLPDYSHQEVCTQTCTGPSECPGTTSCQAVQVTSTDGKSVKTEERHYCLPESPVGAKGVEGNAVAGGGGAR